MRVLWVSILSFLLALMFHLLGVYQMVDVEALTLGFVVGLLLGLGLGILLFAFIQLKRNHTEA